MNLLWAITTLCRTCPIQLEFHYVAGHQDIFSCFEDLPLLAQLNVQADFMAKQVLQILGSQNAPPLLLPIPGLSWSLLIGSFPIASNPCQAILDHVSYQAAILYWIQKGQLSLPLEKLVDWSLLEDALHSSSPTYRMWLSKFASGHSAVGITMACWKKWDSPICPLCHSENESTLHVL